MGHAHTGRWGGGEGEVGRREREFREPLHEWGFTLLQHSGVLERANATVLSSQELFPPAEMAKALQRLRKKSPDLSLDQDAVELHLDFALSSKAVGILGHAIRADTWSSFPYVASLMGASRSSSPSSQGPRAAASRSSSPSSQGSRAAPSNSSSPSSQGPRAAPPNSSPTVPFFLNLNDLYTEQAPDDMEELVQHLQELPSSTSTQTTTAGGTYEGRARTQHSYHRFDGYELASCNRFYNITDFESGMSRNSLGGLAAFGHVERMWQSNARTAVSLARFAEVVVARGLGSTEQCSVVGTLRTISM